jgi:hypothetical protein
MPFECAIAPLLWFYCLVVRLGCIKGVITLSVLRMRGKKALKL